MDGWSTSSVSGWKMGDFHLLHWPRKGFGDLVVANLLADSRGTYRSGKRVLNLGDGSTSQGLPELLQLSTQMEYLEVTDKWNETEQLSYPLLTQTKSLDLACPFPLSFQPQLSDSQLQQEVRPTSAQPPALSATSRLIFSPQADLLLHHQRDGRVEYHKMRSFGLLVPGSRSFAERGSRGVRPGRVGSLDHLLTLLLACVSSCC